MEADDVMLRKSHPNDDSVDDLSSNNLVENELAVDTPLNNENSSSSIRNSSLLLLMEVHLMITLPFW